MWGPFLVIAPASTLHNWHQELVRFVPRLKPLPYWGSPEERQTLRRPWYKKAKTYSEEDSFHIVVTSYQIVSFRLCELLELTFRPCWMRNTSRACDGST